MAGTHHFTRRNQTKQRKNGRCQQTEPTDEYKNTEIIPRSNTKFRKIHTESIRKDGHETFIQKRNKMRMDRGTKHRLQQLKKELTTQPCLANYIGNKENIVTTDACNTGLGIALWQRKQNGELNAIAYASRYINDAEKKYSVGELELLAVVWGLERFRFCLYRKQI